MPLTPILYVILTAFAVHRVWKIWQRKGPWRQLVLWVGAAVAVYLVLLLVLAGPGAKVLDHLSGDTFLIAIAVIAMPLILGLIELRFHIEDGPFPNVRPANIHRRKLYPWMAGVAAVAILMTLALPAVPESWHDNFAIGTFLGAIFGAIVLWFLHYQARRFDYGIAALQTDYWLHWEYRSGELDAWTGLDPAAVPETWMGPAGLLFAGDYAPWDLSVFQLVSASATMEAPPRVNFRFKKTSFGNDTSEIILHVAIPEGHAGDLALLEGKLRGLCPKAKIQVAPE